MRGRRVLGGVLVGLIMAAIGLVGIVAFSGRGPGQCVGPSCSNPTLTLVAVTRDLNSGDTLQNSDWQAVSSNLPGATANLYFTPNQRSLFLGKTLVRPLHSGDLLAKDGDLLAAAGAAYSVVPIAFKVSPGGLNSGDTLCIYAIDGGALRLFYLSPLVVTASPKGWQVTVPPSKAPFFLYAAVNMSLAAFGSTSSGVCPSAPIFSSTQAIEGATGTTGSGG